MRVFVTGATGFIGSAVVRELLDAGHDVTGLARSAASAARLTAAGAKVHRGSVEDVDSLRRGAAAADGAIHTAFYHKLGHMGLRTRLGVFLGGGPGKIVNRFMAAAVGTDRRAMETIGQALSGSDRPLVATFGTLAMTAGRVATEDDRNDPASAGGPRGTSEDAMRSVAATAGVRASIVRLPPIVHGDGDRAGLVPMLAGLARKRHESAYVGDGGNRWPAVHRLDVARLFRLALERGTAGAAYHGVAEQGVAFRQVAEVIGRRVGVPVVGIPADRVGKQFSFLSPFVGVDNPTSSQLTRERLGWLPTGPGLLADLDRAAYFEGTK